MRLTAAHVKNTVIAPTERLGEQRDAGGNGLRRVLLIAHYFPPGTSSGTLRTVKFAKYLPEWNWRPYVLTMRPEAYTPGRQDETLMVRPDLAVYRTPVWAPDRLLAKWKNRLRGSLSAAPGGKGPSSAAAARNAGPSGRTLRDHVRDWLQFPDAYGGWFLPALWRGLDVIRSQNIDLIYSTAPSPVAHVIAMTLKRLTGRPWAADFRDPWECLFPESVYVEGEHPLRQRAEVAVAERAVRAADLVIANTERLREAFQSRFPGIPPGRFVTIPNGFDAEDFDDFPSRPGSDGQFTISYTGTFFTTLRTPDEVLRAIRELVDAGSLDPARLGVNLVGCGAYAADPAPYLNVIPRVSHRESLRVMAESHVLLLLQQSPKYWLQVPAKTYEYFAARRWILAVAPEGATRDVVAPLPYSAAVMPGRTEDLKAAILELYQRYLAGSLYPIKPDERYINRFSRSEQACVLAEGLDRAAKTTIASAAPGRT